MDSAATLLSPLGSAADVQHGHDDDDPLAASSIAVVAVGKAAAAMARGAQFALGARISRGIVVAPTPSHIPGAWETYVGGHPIPNAEGAAGARAIRALATSLRDGETLLCLVSGGASALMALPADGISLADMQSVTNQLLRAGATIGELNCVRKHVDQLKGGRLAALASPASVVALILSDVVGDPVDVIASGPTVADPTTIADAIGILRARGVWESAPASVRAHLEARNDESPKPEDSRLARSAYTLVGNNTKAAAAAAARAKELGYAPRVITTSLTGEAREVGAEIAREALTARAAKDPAEGIALIYAGETTVTVTGNGLGGRNQELVLGAAFTLDGTSGVTMTSIGTDGIDGPTDAAGAWADGDTVRRARERRLDPAAALANNDAYSLLKTIDALVVTGPTGTNVMDLVVVTL
jgi:hydroxypyruvate reductase